MVAFNESSRHRGSGRRKPSRSHNVRSYAALSVLVHAACRRGGDRLGRSGSELRPPTESSEHLSEVDEDLGSLRAELSEPAYERVRRTVAKLLRAVERLDLGTGATD